MGKHGVRKLSLMTVSFLLMGGLLVFGSLQETTALGPVKGWPTPPPEEEPGVEILFEADREEIEPGECATVRWEARPEDAVQRVLGYEAGEPGEGVELENAGQIEACPDTTATYVLKVYTAHGLIERSVTIHVHILSKEKPPTPTPPIVTDPYADRVVSFTPGDPWNSSFGNTNSALGPPDFNEPALTGFLTLGVGGSVTVEFVDNMAVDGPGPDIEILGDPYNDEQWIAEVSADGVSYKSFGRVRERATLDLATVGLASVRFMRLTDDGDPSGGPSPGAELDAVMALNSAAPGAPPSPAPPPGPPPPTPARPAAPSLITDFETMGTWKRGDEPYGTFTQSAEQAYSGFYSGKLAYNFPTQGNDYVVFLHRVPLGGYPNQISAWVYGDGRGHYLNVWVKDSQGESWQATFGQVKHQGWQQMFARLDNLTTWPAGHISGPANGVLDYPIDFQAIVLDDAPDTYIGSGAIYIDDLRAEAAAAPPPPPSPQPPVPSGCPVSFDFRADRTTINAGEQATLIWTMTCPPCTLCAQRVYLDGVEVAGNGSKVVAPTAITTYTLHVVKLDGSSEDRSLTITVTGAPPSPPPAPPPGPPPPPPGPVSINFWADNNQINAGQCTTLHWDVENVREVYLDGQGVVGHGSKQVCPSTTTTYTLHVVKLDGSSEDRTVTIIVIGLLPPAPLPPVLTADLAPTDIYPDNQPQGKVWVRITNNGPDTLTNIKVNITAGVNRSDGIAFLSYFPDYNLTLAPGQTQAINMGVDIDNSKWGYDINVTVESVEYNDPNPGNNSYSESIPFTPQGGPPIIIIPPGGMTWTVPLGP